MVDGIFDSHAHYDDEAFAADRDELLRSLAAHGVRRVMNVGSSMESSRTGIELGKAYDFLYSSVGVHPDSAREINNEMCIRDRLSTGSSTLLDWSLKASPYATPLPLS